jgi:hypothetical protein
VAEPIEGEALTGGGSWLRGKDLNLRPLGYEPGGTFRLVNELFCSLRT